MRTIHKEQLAEILDKHKKWMNDEDGGKLADLSRADLSGADLSRANLSRADLSGANLSGTKNVNDVNWNELTAFYLIVCPEEGSFIGWKTANGFIVKLRITEDAKRSSATSRKCRCSKAEVLAIQNVDGTDAGIAEVRSDRTADFRYRVGETVEVHDFDEDRWNECSKGIHFFITRAEAVNYGK